MAMYSCRMHGQKTRHRRKEKYLDRKDRTMSYKFTSRDMRDYFKANFLDQEKQENIKTATAVT